MSLLMPMFLSAAALVGLPLLLHLLRLQPRKPVPFPALRFLGREALRDSNRQRLRRWLTLLLRCLLILLVVLAFCRPFWPFEHSGKNRAVVVVVDNSYSMQVALRRETVAVWLAPQLAALRQPDQLGVLLLHPTPTWLVPLSDDLEAGRAALKTFPQGYETSHYRAGLELAAAKLALSPAAEKLILVAGDEQRLGWNGVRFDRPLPPGIQLLAAPVAPAPNRQAAIAALKAARTADGRVAFDATVRGFAPATDERMIAFYAGDQKLGTRRCVLTAGRPQTIHADFAVPDLAAALTLHASIDEDDLPVDDTAYVALAATDDRRVILAGVAPGTEVDFLARALASVQGGGLATFRVDPLPAGPVWPPSTVAVLRGAGPFNATSSAALDAFISAGGSAWIICDGSPEQTAWLARHGVTVAPARAPAGGKLKLRDLLLDHPLFAPFAGHSIAPLLTPTFRRGWALDGPTLEPLARWLDRTVAIAELPTGAGRLLITGFGETRADSTFPVEAGYVPFVHQAVAWLAQNQLATPQGGRVGATLPLPGAGRWRPVLSPAPAPPIAVNGFVTPTAPGLYVFEQPATGTKRFYAVNLDTAESDLTPWPAPAEFAQLVNRDSGKTETAKVALHPRNPPVADAQLVDERQAWWWLLAVAVLLLFLELALANRTIP